MENIGLTPDNQQIIFTWIFGNAYVLAFLMIKINCAPPFWGVRTYMIHKLTYSFLFNMLAPTLVIISFKESFANFFNLLSFAEALAVLVVPSILIFLCITFPVYIPPNTVGIKWYHRKFYSYLKPGWHFIIPFIYRADILEKGQEIERDTLRVKVKTQDGHPRKISFTYSVKVQDLKQLMQYSQGIENGPISRHIAKLFYPTIQKVWAKWPTEEYIDDYGNTKHRISSSRYFQINTEIAIAISEKLKQMGLKLENYKVEDIENPEN